MDIVFYVKDIQVSFVSLAFSKTFDNADEHVMHSGSSGNEITNYSSSSNISILYPKFV